MSREEVEESTHLKFQPNQSATSHFVKAAKISTCVVQYINEKD